MKWVCYLLSLHQKVSLYVEASDDVSDCQSVVDWICSESNAGHLPTQHIYISCMRGRLGG